MAYIDIPTDACEYLATGTNNQTTVNKTKFVPKLKKAGMKKLILLPLLCVLSIAKAQTYDSLEYATGTKSAQQQLMSYPLPRYKPGHTLNRNFIWFGLNYFSGAQQSGVTNQQMINTAK